MDRLQVPSMRMRWLFVFSVLQAMASITAVAVTNVTASGYNAAELLAKIFHPNATIESRQRGYGFIKFEDRPEPGVDHDDQETGQYGLIDPERDQRPLKFEDEYNENYNGNYGNNNQFSDDNKPLKFQDTEDGLPSSHGIVFQDDNNVDAQGNNKKRRKRRRRKPKNGLLPYPGVGGLSAGRPGIDSGRPGFPGYQGPLQAGYGLNPQIYPGYPGVQPLRRPRRPKPRPSLATEALSPVTEALTSIARYDDYQCVPRLLCEAAGGGALSSNGVLESIAGIQPLLTLLSVYNGISTSPLFVFGRAVFLGMTSKGNTGTCRYAYPQCPTNPEQLIYYLNNHNGGFFRFFNAPQLPNQNLEQFYNQLGNQGYGIYQPQQGSVQQLYGYPNDPSSGQHYGLYPNNQYPNQGQYYGHSGFQGPGAYHKPSLYNNENYGANYAYDFNNYGNGNQIRFRDSDARIEKRIQNKPVQHFADSEIDAFEDDDTRTKWQFPEELSADINQNNNNIRDSRKLKFPEESQQYNSQKESTRKGKKVYFPDKNNQNYYNNRQPVFTNNDRYQTTTHSYSNEQNHNYYTNTPNSHSNNYGYKPHVKYHNYNYNPNTGSNDHQNIYDNNHRYQSNTIFNNEEYVFDHKHNFYVKKEKNNNNSYNINNNYNNYSNNGHNSNNYKRSENDGLNTVYVVRGNGDPNNPEIVKLRPGQSI